MLELQQFQGSGSLIRGPFELAPGALLALHVAQPQRYPFLLESAAAGEPLGRYDILFGLPRDRLVLDARGVTHATTTLPVGDSGFLHSLDAWWQHAASRSIPAERSVDLPFAGGWFLYLGYELAGEIEPTLALPRPDDGLPIAEAVRCPAAVIRECRSSLAWIVVEPDVAHWMPELERAVVRACPATRTRGGAPLVAELEEEAPERFLHAVSQALGHVTAGDIYQANLSRAWRGRLADYATAADVYQRLCRTNPGPFAALAALEGRTIVSSSPERLVAVQDGHVATRPIAGTRPRGATRELDDALIKELRAHPKERAEHVMLLDLERNDLGRICRPGTVTVDEYMVIETYAHVHHIVSNVRGDLQTGTTPGEVIRAVFPGGTITGCPKVRCMDIIGALEGEPRGAYTGSLGYLGLDGSMDLNILIRTIELRADEFRFRAGAGIVAESQPQRELDETRAKALGLTRALIEPAP